MTIGQIGPRSSPQRFDGPLIAGGEDARDYSFDCEKDVSSGASVTAASLAIAPSGTLECSIVAIALSGTQLTARIKSGQPRVYTAKWVFTIDGGPPGGDSLEYVTEIACNPQLPGDIATDPDSADFGTPSTVTA